MYAVAHMLFAKPILYIFSVAYTWSEDPELHVKGTPRHFDVFEVDDDIVSSQPIRVPDNVIDSQAVQLFSEVSGFKHFLVRVHLKLKHAVL